MSWLKTAVAAVGVGTSLWGANKDNDANKDAIKAQQQQNEANNEFIREQAERSRHDLLPLFAAGSENRIAGADAALDAMRLGLFQGQIPAFQQGNVGAQSALLAGLPQIQNAILGNPVDMSALQPQKINLNQQALLGMFNTPDFKSSGDAMQDYTQQKQTKEDALKYNPLSAAKAGTTTNRQVVDMLHEAGQLSDTDYNRMQTTFRNEPNVANSKWWMQAGSQDKLLQGLDASSGISKEYYGTLDRLYRSIYPGQQTPQRTQQQGQQVAQMLGGTSPKIQFNQGQAGNLQNNPQAVYGISQALRGNLNRLW